MSAPFSGPSRLPNPFSRPVVDGPRDVRASAESIHRDALAHLLRAFEELAAQPLPRLQRGPLAVRVISQMPGSGKSHLLGRLWQALNGRATVIFLRAHQDRHAFWRRILERLVQELEQPEATDQRTLAPGDATQLDGLARHLLADLIERNAATKAPSKSRDKALHDLRHGSPSVLAGVRRQFANLLRGLDTLVPTWMQQLAQAGVRLERDPVAWLKVLCHYTLHPANHPVRLLALAWLQGKELEPEEAPLLGLSASQCRVCPPGDISESSLNESAFQAVKDLCALGAFFRPLVFAFDQTEIYGQDEALARAFGATIARLQDECINQLTLITANEQPWQHRLWARFEQADQDRFDLTRQVMLKGIDLAQARELLRVKLRQAEWPSTDIDALCQADWLATLFANPATRPLAREVEKAACQAIATLADQPSPQQALSSPERELARHRERLLATPQKLAFDIGVLLWALNDGVAHVPGLSVVPNFAQPKRRLQGCWQWLGHALLLILDDSTHGGHWKAVVADYHRQADVERAQGREVRGAVLRHHSLKPMGEGTRQLLASAQATGLRVVDMPDPLMASLYAAQALYGEVCTGDAENLRLDDLLAHLGVALRAVVEHVVGHALPEAAPPPPPPEPKPTTETRTPTADPSVTRRQEVHLTVTELVCACARPGWLAQWQLGQRPSTAPLGGDGVLTYGNRLHVIAQRFAQWATADATLYPAARLDTLPKIESQLSLLGGQTLEKQLRKRGGTAQALTRLRAHTRQLARHFVESRQACTDFRTWRDVFLVQEYPLKGVPLAERGGRVVRVSGRMDSLRHQLPHDVRLLDYKFTPANAPEEALLQLAIYQHMLRQQHGVNADGDVVFLSPPGERVARSAAELAGLFTERVQPVLDRLLGPNTESAATRPTDAELSLGLERGSERPITLPLADLTRHSAVLGSSGSGKTTTALHLLEQVLERGVPVVLLDRKGDLCRYAQPEAWNDPANGPDNPEARERRALLRQRLAVTVYTPGSLQGNGLRLPLAPAELAQLPREERDEAAQESADVLAAALGLTRASDQTKKAILVCAFQVLARRITGRGLVLDDVLNLLSSDDPELLNAIGVLDSKHCQKLADQVQTFKINNGRLLDERAETLDWTRWLSPRPDGRIPLTIVSTKFLGAEEGSVLFWVAQFFLELLRFVGRRPSAQLQGMLMIDEADLYLPATKTPPTKGPLESLLKRARSGGVGLMLCTQSPGDLDYKGRDNIRNWWLGLIQQARALEKIEGLLADSRLPATQLSKQRVGQFVFAAEGRATLLEVPANLIPTRQLPDGDILQVARSARSD